MFKVSRIFDKNFEHDAHGLKESPEPNTLQEDLFQGPWSFYVA